MVALFKSIISIAFGLVFDLIGGLIAMWGLAIAHHSDATVPAFGYVTCFGIAFAATGVIGAALGAQRISDMIQAA